MTLTLTIGVSLYLLLNFHAGLIKILDTGSLPVIPLWQSAYSAIQTAQTKSTAFECLSLLRSINIWHNTRDFH